MKYTIATYLDDGRVFSYEVGSASSAREHASAIVLGGYRHNAKKVFEHYPPHRILKIKITPALDTLYPDKVRGT